MIELVVNGQVRRVLPDSTVAELLGEMEVVEDRVAVEMNGVVLDRRDFSRTTLKDGDRMEIIAFVGGGERS